MAQSQVYEGTLEQLVKQLRKLPDTHKYKIVVTSNDLETAQKSPQMLTFGMFPQLQAITEEDFKSAEWRDEDTEIQ